MQSITVRLKLEGIKLPTHEMRTVDTDTSDLEKSMVALGGYPHGQLQPIIVEPAPDDGVIILEGCRRFRAATKLKWPDIEAKIQLTSNKREGDVIAFVANVVRKAFHWTDMAEGCVYLATSFSEKRIAEMTGYHPTYVHNLIRAKRQLHPMIWQKACQPKGGVTLDLALMLASKSLSEQLDDFGESRQKLLSDSGRKGIIRPKRIKALMGMIPKTWSPDKREGARIAFEICSGVRDDFE